MLNIKSITRFLLYFIFLMNPSIQAGGLAPKKSQSTLVSGIVSDLKSKGYLLEPKSQFHIKLKVNESIRYIITSPFFLSNTMVGIASDETVKKFKVLFYTLSGREDSKGRLVEGEESSSNIYLKEIKERSYYYMVEITLLESHNSEYSSIDMMYGFKALNFAKEDSKIRENYYEHSDEKYLFEPSNKAKQAKEKPTPSDTGGVPCTTFDANRSCMGR
jgi:hypothetical protein